MAKKEVMNLQLPIEQIEYIREVAKLVGVSINSAAAVLIAVQVMQAKPTHPERK